MFGVVTFQHNLIIGGCEVNLVKLIFTNATFVLKMRFYCNLLRSLPRFLEPFNSFILIENRTKTVIISVQHSQWQPHSDMLTSLEFVIHNDRLLVLSASSDCSVALWDIHGNQIGVFGQVGYCFYMPSSSINILVVRVQKSHVSTQRGEQCS